MHIYIYICVPVHCVCMYNMSIAVLTSLQFDESSCTALAKPKMDG